MGKFKYCLLVVGGSKSCQKASARLPSSRVSAAVQGGHLFSQVDGTLVSSKAAVLSGWLAYPPSSLGALFEMESFLMQKPHTQSAVYL